MDSQCFKCDLFNFPGEAIDNEFTSCCNKGTIIIPPLTQLTQDIIKKGVEHPGETAYKIILNQSIGIKNFYVSL